MSNPSRATERDRAAGAGIRSGSALGDFDVGRQIGRGGMGTVYEARQRSLDRLVALKVLSDQATLTPTAVARFQREAQAAAKLHHPNIVPIFDQGDEQGSYYYAMELLDGPSVDRIIAHMRGDTATESINPALADTRPLTQQDRAPRDGPEGMSDFTASTVISKRGRRCPPEEFVKIARALAAVADALHYAHERGIVHRDVKPHNLIFADERRLCISDFGLARVLEQPGVTVTGEFLGSPLYMAPEQITGLAAQVGPRSDIYSLGATLYEWVTLRPPFPGTTRAQVISQIVQTDPVAPRAIDPNIPVDLETVCLKSLEKNPDRRYGSAAELARDLRRFAEGERIRARRVGWPGRTTRYLVRRPVLTISAAGILLIAVLGTALVRARSATTTTHRELQARISEYEHQTQQLESQNLAQQRLIEDFARGASLGQSIKEYIPGAETLLVGRIDAADRDLARRLASMLQKTQREAEHAAREGLEPPNDEQSPDHLYLAGLAAVDRDTALRWLNQCLEREPGHFDARRFRAAVYCALQKFVEMQADADELVRLDAQRSEGYLLRAMARFFSPGAGAAQIPAVIADLDDALRVAGASPWLRALRGLALVRSGDAAAAVGEFDQVLQGVPDMVVALAGRGRARLTLHDVPAALEDFSQIIALESGNGVAYALRGECYDLLERYDLSLLDYDRAFQLTGSLSLIPKYTLAFSNWQKQQPGATPPSSDARMSPGEQPSDDLDAPTSDEHLEWLNRYLRQKQERDRRSMRVSPSAALGWYGRR